jgi:SAM-dependent methyltransferase
MRVTQAIDMLAPAFVAIEAATTWADLGCGSGTFTRALAHLLAPGSTIHAMDANRAALSQLPPQCKDVRIRAWPGDFLEQPWPFGALDGVLLANSLHYVRDARALIRECVANMKPKHRFLIVEYDTDEANRWVPHPLSARALDSLFSGEGYPPIQVLGSRQSIYQRARMYAALAMPAIGAWT